MTQTRRRFLATTLSLAGAAGLVRAPPVQAAEGPPEITSVRIVKIPGDCLAPQYIAEELLRAEGFSDIRYVDKPGNALPETIARGEADFGFDFAPDAVAMIDRGVAITVLSGVHVGCIELLANESIRSVSDLKGKRVGIPGFGNSSHVHITLMAAHVGLDPSKDIHWVVDPAEKQLFIDGKIDAFIGVSPDPQELRPSGRTRPAEDCRGSPVVAVFLLHADRQPRIRPKLSGSHETGGAHDPESS
jgi:NitT/TauT family transport system substrate-binding protein